MERLATLDFVHKAQNLFITGSSGTGKSYLACALGHEACKRGFRTFYANAPKLLGALKVAKVKGTLETELKKIELEVLSLSPFLPSVHSRKSARKYPRFPEAYLCTQQSPETLSSQFFLL